MNSNNPISSNELSLHNTRMSADRTLMSWIQTSLSMISFGFTTYKFLQTLQEQNNTAPVNSQSPRILLNTGPLS